jgi:regulatory protein
MASSNSGGALASAPRPDKKARRRAPAHLTPASLEAAALRYLERYASSAENLRRVLLRRVRRADAGEDGAALVEALVERFRAACILDVGR